MNETTVPAWVLDALGGLVDEDPPFLVSGLMELDGTVSRITYAQAAIDPPHQWTPVGDWWHDWDPLSGDPEPRDTLKTLRASVDQALASRPDQPPHDLGQALMDGWAALVYSTTSGPGIDVYHLGEWRCWYLEAGRRWSHVSHRAQPIAWPALTPDQRAAILTVWAEVRAWRAGGPAPWDRTETTSGRDR